MATIYVTCDRNGYRLSADRDIEPPQIEGFHSVGGGHNVPSHDREAHRLGVPHECSTIRDARNYRAATGPDIPAGRVKRLLVEQYRNHDLVWRGFGS